MSTRKLFTLILVSVVVLGISTADAQTGTSSASGQRIWGYTFGDFFWKADGDTARWGRGEYMGTEKGMMGGSLRRLYLGYDNQISSRFSTRVLLEANPGTTMPNGSYGVIIKLGYLQWKAPDFLFNNQQFSVGLIPTPIFAFPERTWGYRSVEKEALDSRGIGRSVDQGISYNATFDKDSNYGFTLMVANGSGTRPANDKYFEYTGSLYLRLLEKRLTLETMGNYKYQGNGRHSSIYRGFIGYEITRFRFGFEASKIHDNLSTSAGMISQNPFLYSIFYAFKMKVMKQDFEFFARYDKFNPDLDFSDSKIYPNDRRFVYDQSLLIFGVNYNPIPTVSIIPNIYINLYDDKRAQEVNRKNDVVLRITLYYRY
jgi:hypothetical protein